VEPLPVKNIDGQKHCHSKTLPLKPTLSKLLTKAGQKHCQSKTLPVKNIASQKHCWPKI
jgi:hypothetical protein